MIAMQNYYPESTPLYINRVQQVFETLPPDQTSTIQLHLLLDQSGLCKCISFKVPNQDLEVDSCPDVLGKYLLARINNLLVTFGGIRLTVYLDTANLLLVGLIQQALALFDIDNPRNNRKGPGSFINYINRMNLVAGFPPFSVTLRDQSEYRPSTAVNGFRLPAVPDQPVAGEPFGPARMSLRKAASDLENKIYCGFDIGGNSIKAAAVVDGKVFLLKTYPWNPSQLKTADELLQPITLLARLFAVVIRYWQVNHHRPPEGCPAVLVEAATYNQILDFTMTVENELAKMLSSTGQTSGEIQPVFDGIAVGFPDIVVNNKIAGGETYKQRGIRQHNPDTYEFEMEKMSRLDDQLSVFLKPDGVFRMVNDGNLASFVFSVEQAFIQDSCIDETGMFNFTIGTEMGTGYISRDGSVLRLPLECYNYIIDLGNAASSIYHSNDIRSINNFNTGIPGTIQKYISQTGLIRMACQELSWTDRERFAELLTEGYLQYNAASDELTIVTQPADQRGPLTHLLIQWMKEGNKAVQSAYQQIGYCIGVVIDEVRFLLPELVPHKFVSGGLVNEDACFDRLREGLTAYTPDYCVRRLEMDRLESPLLNDLNKKQANYSVALGAAYLCNLVWIKAHG